MALLPERLEGVLRAVPPPLSLVGVPGVLLDPEREGRDAGTSSRSGAGAPGSHWRGGIAVEPEACSVELSLAVADGTPTTDFPYWWVECGDSGASAVDVLASGIKGVGAPPDPVTVTPYTLVAGYQCSALDVHSNARRAEVEARVRRRLEAITPAAVERELWNGQLADAAGYTNPALTDAGTLTTLLGGVPTGFVTALGELEQALAEQDHRGGHMIHAQPRVVTAWMQAGLVHLVPGRTHLETALGTVVVPGSGYPGTSPKPTQTAATYATSWAYGTGWVRVVLGTVTVETQDATTLTRTLNDVTLRAEREAVALWDTCSHVGINVSTCDELCGVGS